MTTTDPSERFGAKPIRLRRPLDGLTSIKLKLSILILAAVAITAFASQVGVWLDWPLWIRFSVAVAAALALVQFLARGLTKPLRRMTEAATAMARGDYSRRVRVNSRDEVALLAHSFNAMASDLAEVDRQRKEFVANASHELRTPVAALRSTLENLVDGVAEPDDSTLAHMLSRAEHLSLLVGQLLDLSRLDSGTDDPAREPVDLMALLADVVGEVDEAHGQVPFSLNGPDQLVVTAQPWRLRQVFTNVLGNAARFSDAGNPVEVTACLLEPTDREPDGRAASSRSWARVEVRDSGPGIPESQRHLVFERFWQADGTRTGAGGAGLGLAISKQIVDQHHGTIRAEPNEGGGTCFAIELPVDEQA